MVDITLVHTYVVKRIVDVGLETGCLFPNHGGNKQGLVTRIMGKFSTPETGHLQTCADKNGFCEFEKVRDLIIKFISEKKFEDVIDLWKEICNRKHEREYSLLDWPDIIDNILRQHQYLFTRFFESINSKRLNVGYATVENAFKAACQNCAKAGEAKDQTQYEKYIDKLERILFSYPFLQEVFVKEMFGEEFFSELLLFSTLHNARMSHIKKTIHSRFTANANKEQEKPMQAAQPSTQYIHFMGREHLVQPLIRFNQDDDRFQIECDHVSAALTALEKNSDKESTIAFIKGIIHRSPNQRELCGLIVYPNDLTILDSFDPRKRSMVIDDILDIRVGRSAKEVVQSHAEMKQQEQIDAYLGTMKQVRPEWFEQVVGQAADAEENAKLLISNYLRSVPSSETTSAPRFPEYPNMDNTDPTPSDSEEVQRTVSIYGDPTDPLVQKLAEMFDAKVTAPKAEDKPEAEPLKAKDIISDLKIKDVISNLDDIVKMLENRPSFKSRLTQNLDKIRTGLDRAGEIAKIAQTLDGSFKALTGIDPSDLNKGFAYPNLVEEPCQDPACPVHGDVDVGLIQSLLSKRQFHSMDHFIGIDTGVPGSDRTVFVRTDAGKRREQGPYDFSGMFKFLTNHFDPKFTATEIKSNPHNPFTKSFVINDANGEFFCEYKMSWSMLETRYMVTHQKPGTEGGRQLHIMEGFTDTLSHSQASERFKKIREMAIKDPHKPKPDPFKKVEPEVTVTKAEVKTGTEMVKRILLIGMKRHEMMFNTDTNRLTIFVDEQQLFTGIVDGEDQANFVWDYYKKGTAIGVGQNAIAAAIAELNGL